MVGAYNAFNLTTATHKLGITMTAHIRKSTDFIFALTNDEDLLTNNFSAKKTADRLKLIPMPDANPITGKNAFAFQRVKGR